MQNKRSLVAWLVGVLLLAATIGIPAWLLNRGKEETGPVIPVNSLDIVCTGRVDAAGFVRALEPNQPGRVLKVHVKEGQAVKKDDEIVTLDPQAYDYALMDAERNKSIIALELAAVKAKQAAHPATISYLEKNIEAAKQNAKAMDDKLTQMKDQLKLTEKSPITKADVDAYEAQIGAFRSNIAAENIRLEQMEEQKKTLQLEVDGAELKLKIAEDAIKRAKKAKEETVIRAPAAGTIIRLQVDEGSILTPGNPLDPAIIFAPAGPYIVRAEVEQADIGRVTKGMTAKLRDDSRRDDTEWVGTVKEIGYWIAPKRKHLLDPGEFNDVRTIEILVELKPSENRLWIGQRMVLKLSK